MASKQESDMENEQNYTVEYVGNQYVYNTNYCLSKCATTKVMYPKYTVVKWGHTEGIEREKTSSQNSQGIALIFWIHFSHTIGGRIQLEGNTCKI